MAISSSSSSNGGLHPSRFLPFFSSPCPSSQAPVIRPRYGTFDPRCLPQCPQSLQPLPEPHPPSFLTSFTWTLSWRLREDFRHLQPSPFHPFLPLDQPHAPMAAHRLPFPTRKELDEWFLSFPIPPPNRDFPLFFFSIDTDDLIVCVFSLVVLNFPWI